DDFVIWGSSLCRLDKDRLHCVSKYSFYLKDFPTIHLKELKVAGPFLCVLDKNGWTCRLWAKEGNFGLGNGTFIDGQTPCVLQGHVCHTPYGDVVWSIPENRPITAVDLRYSQGFAT